MDPYRYIQAEYELYRRIDEVPQDDYDAPPAPQKRDSAAGPAPARARLAVVLVSSVVIVVGAVVVFLALAAA